MRTQTLYAVYTKAAEMPADFNGIVYPLAPNDMYTTYREAEQVCYFPTEREVRRFKAAYDTPEHVYLAATDASEIRWLMGIVSDAAPYIIAERTPHAGWYLHTMSSYAELIDEYENICGIRPKKSARRCA